MLNRKESLNTAFTKLVDASQRVAKALFKIALNLHTKVMPSFQNESVFRIIQIGVQDAKMN